MFVEAIRFFCRVGEGAAGIRWMKLVAQNVPPNEELHADFLGRVDEILPLRDFTLSARVRGEHLGIPEIGVLSNSS